MDESLRKDIAALVSAIDYSEALTVTASENTAREACRLEITS